MMSGRLKIAVSIGIVSSLLFHCSDDKSTNNVPTIPAAPSGLVAQAMSTSSIQLTWVDNSDNETGFIVFRSQTGDFGEVDTTAADQTSFTDTGLEDSTAYSYYVVATNALGNSPPSDTVTATPSNIVFVGNLEIPGTAEDIFIAGNYAYIAAYQSGLFIVDIADPSEPTLEGTYDTPGMANRVYVSGSYVYLACASGLQIVDVSNPAQPVLAGDFAADNVFDVSVFGDYAYISDRGADFLSPSLKVVNVADPSQPVLTCIYDCAARNIFTRNNLAYVATYDISEGGGLLILNIADPANPVSRGQCDTEGGVDIYVSGDYAYLPALSSGLLIADISNPQHPTIAGAYDPTPSHAEHVDVSGSYAFVAEADYGIHVVDVSDPGQPVPVGIYDTEGSARGVAVSGDYIYVADNWKDLQVLRFLY